MQHERYPNDAKFVTPINGTRIPVHARDRVEAKEQAGLAGYKTLLPPTRLGVDPVASAMIDEIERNHKFELASAKHKMWAAIWWGCFTTPFAIGWWFQ